MIGKRIKQGRVAAGLSQQALGEAIGVSTMAVSKYERDAMTPSSEVLLRLSETLGVRTEYFFRQAELEVTAPEFRKHKELSPKEEARVLAQMRELIERWIDLEEHIPTTWSSPFKVPPRLPKSISKLEDVETVAEKAREHWKLGSQPISDLTDLLESKGIKVFLLPYDAGKRWDGLVAKANGQPVIVVGADWPGDRQRFTLAHELGHLVLDGRLTGDLASGKEEEYACHRFAGAFLMPASAVVETFGPKRNWLEPRELYLAKHEWGISMNALIYRARDVGVLNKAQVGKTWGYFKKQGWHELEPGSPFPKEQPRAFAQYVYRALGEDHISESKAAELLGMTLSKLREQRQVKDEPADVHPGSR